MHFDFGIIKRHPVAIAGIVFGVGIAWLLIHNASSSSSSSTASGPSAAQVQAAAQLALGQQQGQYAEALANIQAATQSHLADVAGGVATTQSSNQLTATLAAIEAEMNKNSLDAGVQQAALDTQYKLGQLSANVAATQIQDATAVQLKQIQLQDTEAARAQYDFQTATRLQNDLAENTLNKNTVLFSELLNKLPNAA